MGQFFLDWFAQLEKTFIQNGGYKMILQGLGNTAIITIFALIIGVVLGSILAISKYFEKEGIVYKILGAISDLYATINPLDDFKIIK